MPNPTTTNNITIPQHPNNPHSPTPLQHHTIILSTRLPNPNLHSRLQSTKRRHTRMQPNIPRLLHLPQHSQHTRTPTTLQKPNHKHNQKKTTIIHIPEPQLKQQTPTIRKTHRNTQNSRRTRLYTNHKTNRPPHRQPLTNITPIIQQKSPQPTHTINQAVQLHTQLEHQGQENHTIAHTTPKLT